MYDLWDHRSMVADRVRVETHARAIRAVVRPGDVVLDLGCGVGVFTVVAARCGAKHVYGVDLDDSVHYAMRVVRENGVADRVTLFRGRVEDVTLPEPATVLVTDVRGALPLDAGAVDAWNGGLRLLAPGGRTVPLRDRVLAQPVSSEKLFASTWGFGPVAGVTFECLRASLAHGRFRDPGDVTTLADPKVAFQVDYGRPLDGRHDGRVEFTADRPWTLDGFVVGFEAELAPGISFRSLGPDKAPAYGISVLAAPERLSLSRGETVALRLETRKIGADVQLRWAVDARGREGAWQGPIHEDGQSLDVLKASLPDHVPGPDPTDDVDARLLASFERGRSLGEAVREAMASLPAGTDPAHVAGRARALSQRRQARVVRRLDGA
jgi:SAM-dependent methyltransferase